MFSKIESLNKERISLIVQWLKDYKFYGNEIRPIFS